MAESKRNSVAGKVVTPKPASQGPPEVDAFIKAVGAHVRIVTLLTDHVIEGTIFAACSTTNLIAIKELDRPAPPNPSSSTAAPSFRILSPSSIASFQFISAASDAEKSEAFGSDLTGGAAAPSITQADRNELRKREAEAVRKAKAFEESRGKGVTVEAQDLFDWIQRTLPVRWSDRQIVVSEAVVIDAPYAVENCKAVRDKGAALAQIKKVVEGFWAKRKKPGAARAVPAVPVLRKGG